MSYVDKNLIPGEGVLYRTGLHWIVLVLPILVAALFGLPAVLILIVGSRGRVDPPGSAGIVGSVLLACAVTALLVGILKRSATEMAVTNKRVVIKTGILTRRTYEILLSKVESIHVEEGLLGRLLGHPHTRRLRAGSQES